MTRCSLQRADGIGPMADGTDQSGNRHESVPCSDSVLSAISYQLLHSMNPHRGNGCTEEFTGAGQKQPGRSVYAETRLYGSLETSALAAGRSHRCTAVDVARGLRRYCV
jgi:hypothetical protein